MIRADFGTRSKFSCVNRSVVTGSQVRDCVTHPVGPYSSMGLCMLFVDKLSSIVRSSSLAHGVVPTLAASGAALATAVLKAGLATDAAVLSRILALLKVTLCGGILTRVR